MLSQIKQFQMDQSRNQAEIKSAMDGYYKIIQTLQDKIQSHHPIYTM